MAKGQEDDPRLPGEEQLRQNEKGWDGRHGDKPGTWQKIVTSGGVVSGPYVPQGTKRIGEVR